MAFQVSEELFRKIKEYLARYEEIYHRKLTQRDFVLGLIESALEEAEDDFAAYQTAQQEEQNESWGGCDSEKPLTHLPE